MRHVPRRLVLLAFVSLIASPMAAQERNFTYGPMVGLSLSKAGGADVQNAKAAWGTAVGVFLTLGASGRFGFEPQLLLVEKAVKTEDNGVSGNVKISYLQLPLLGKVRFPLGSSMKGFLFAGPGLGLKVGCKLTLAAEGDEITGGCNEGEEEEGQIHNSEISAMGGLGVEIGRAIIALRYDHGFSTIDRSELTDIKNRMLMLTAGARLRLNP